MDLDIHDGNSIFHLTKKEITKRLLDAVRESQGGAKRASWAQKNRPSWWQPECDVRMPDGDIVKSLKFESQRTGYWNIDNARATLLLYETYRRLGHERFNQSHHAETLEPESPNVVKDDEEASVEATEEEEGTGNKRLRKRGTPGKKKKKNVVVKPDVTVINLDEDEIIVTDANDMNSEETLDKAHSHDENHAVGVDTTKKSVGTELAEADIVENDEDASMEKGRKLRKKRKGRRSTKERNRMSEESSRVVDQCLEKEDEEFESIDQTMNSSKQKLEDGQRAVEDNENEEHTSTKSSEGGDDEATLEHAVNALDAGQSSELVQDGEAMQEDDELSDQTEQRTDDGADESLDQTVVGIPEDAHDDPHEEATDNSSTEMEATTTVGQPSESEIAKIQRKLEVDLVTFRRTCKAKRDMLSRQHGVEADCIKSEHNLIKYSIPKEALDMLMKDYVQKCNADSHKWLLHAVEGRVTRACNGEESVEKPISTATSYQQERREEVLRTTRKATRAARERETLTSKTPATLARARPRRTAAETATKRNQAILGRKGNGASSTAARAAIEESAETDDDGTHTPETQRRLNAERMDREAVIKMLRTKKDPRKFFEECLAAYSQEVDGED